MSGVALVLGLAAIAALPLVRKLAHDREPVADPSVPKEGLSWPRGGTPASPAGSWCSIRTAVEALEPDRAWGATMVVPVGDPVAEVDWSGLPAGCRRRPYDRCWPGTNVTRKEVL